MKYASCRALPIFGIILTKMYRRRNPTYIGDTRLKQAPWEHFYARCKVCSYEFHLAAYDLDGFIHSMKIGSKFSYRGGLFRCDFCHSVYTTQYGNEIPAVEVGSEPIYYATHNSRTSGDRWAVVDTRDWKLLSAHATRLEEKREICRAKGIPFTAKEQARESADSLNLREGRERWIIVPVKYEAPTKTFAVIKAEGRFRESPTRENLERLNYLRSFAGLDPIPWCKCRHRWIEKSDYVILHDSSGGYRHTETWDECSICGLMKGSSDHADCLNPSCGSFR